MDRKNGYYMVKSNTAFLNLCQIFFQSLAWCPPNLKIRVNKKILQGWFALLVLDPLRKYWTTTRHFTTWRVEIIYWWGVPFFCVGCFSFAWPVHKIIPGNLTMLVMQFLIIKLLTSRQTYSLNRSLTHSLSDRLLTGCQVIEISIPPPSPRLRQFKYNTSIDLRSCLWCPCNLLYNWIMLGKWFFLHNKYVWHLCSCRCCLLTF